jgi:chromosome segregation ATPase
MQQRSVCLILVVVVLMAGCATDRGRTQAEGTAVGAGIGTALGAGLGYLLGGKQGALIGAGAGALVGGTTGLVWSSHVASKKEQYAHEEDYLDAVIGSARDMNEKTRLYNASLTNDINKLDQETDALIQQYNQKQIKKATLEAKRKETEAKMTEARHKLDTVQKEIDIQQTVLKKEKEQGQSVQAQARLNTMDAQIHQLEQHRDELGKLFDTLAGIGARAKV